MDELEETLAEADPIVLYTFKGLNTDSGNYAKEATFEGKDKFRVDNGLLFTAVVEARVIKSEAELEVMRYVNAVTCDAHMAVMAHARPGLKEYQLESLFQHWCYCECGGAGGKRDVAAVVPLWWCRCGGARAFVVGGLLAQRVCRVQASRASKARRITVVQVLTRAQSPSITLVVTFLRPQHTRARTRAHRQRRRSQYVVHVHLRQRQERRHVALRPRRRAQREDR